MEFFFVKTDKDGIYVPTKLSILIYRFWEWVWSYVFTRNPNFAVSLGMFLIENANMVLVDYEKTEDFLLHTLKFAHTDDEPGPYQYNISDFKIRIGCGKNKNRESQILTLAFNKNGSFNYYSLDG